MAVAVYSQRQTSVMSTSSGELGLERAERPLDDAVLVPGTAALLVLLLGDPEEHRLGTPSRRARPPRRRGRRRCSAPFRAAPRSAPRARRRTASRSRRGRGASHRPASAGSQRTSDPRGDELTGNDSAARRRSGENRQSDERHGLIRMRRPPERGHTSHGAQIDVTKRRRHSSDLLLAAAGAPGASTSTSTGSRARRPPTARARSAPRRTPSGPQCIASVGSAMSAPGSP